MALLRLCEKFGGAFVKSMMHCQIEYNRGLGHLARIQGYVTVVARTDCPVVSIEKPEISIDTNENSITSGNTKSATIHSQLSKLCREWKSGEIEKQKLLRLMSDPEGTETSVCPETFGLSLLRYCGHVLSNVRLSERRNLTKQVWALIQAELPSPTLHHYKVLLAAYARNSQTVDPNKFLAEMKVPADAEIYRLLLKCVAKKGDVDSTLGVLSLMKSTGSVESEVVLDSLVQVYAAKGDVKSVLSQLEVMEAAGIMPSVQTWTYVACGYANIGDIANVRKILTARKPNVKQIMEIVESFSLSDNGKRVKAVLQHLPEGTDFGNSTIANAIAELTYAGRPQDAFAIVDRVTTSVSTERRASFLEDFLRNLVRAETQIDVVLKITDQLVREKKYSFAMVDVCGAALDCGDWKLATTLFELMREKGIAVRPHYYWPILLHTARNEGEAGILDTIRQMLSLDVTVDHDTLCDYVFPHVNTSDIASTIRKFADVGLEASTFATPLICRLLMGGNLADAVKLCAKYSSMIDFSRIHHPLCVAYTIKPDVQHCVDILKDAPRNKYYPEEFLMRLFGKVPRKADVPKVATFLRAFEARDVPVASFGEYNGDRAREEERNTTETSTRMMNPLDSCRSIDKIPHPRDMSVDELECHLIELRAKGMNKRGVLRKLLLLHCRRNNVNRVCEIKKEYDDNGYLWTSGLYSALFQFYAQNGQVAEARDLYKLLRRYHPDFKIDDVKIVRFATALVGDGSMDEVITVLQSMRSNGGPLAAKESWRLLNAVAHSEEFSEMTENILEILVRHGYCDKTNSMLGPLVRRHLLKNDIESAARTFRELAEKHKCTPLRQELIYALLKSIKENGSTKDRSVKLLDDVRNITTNLYGTNGLNVDLALGFARNCMRQELQHFFETNHVSDNLLIQNLAYTSDSDKLLILTEILDSCPNVTSAQRNIIIEECISVYNRSGNCQGAIELWNKMTDKNIPGSRTFMVNFVNLLEKHNVPLPENFEAF